jgi:hypothetical protein
MCALLAPEQFEGFNLNMIYENVSIVGWCPVDINIPASEGPLRWAPKSKIATFSKATQMILIKKGDNLPH